MSVAEFVPRRRQRDMALAFGAFLVAVILWQVQGIGVVTYPFRLFVTMVHELGHGVAAILTGGSFLRFEVTEHGAGLAYTRGGARFIILQAGYLGTALFGATLLVLTARVRRVGAVAIGLGAFISILSALYSGIRVANLTALEMLLAGAVIAAAATLILTREAAHGRLLGAGLAAVGALLFVLFGGSENSLRTIVVGGVSGLLLIALGARGGRDLVLITLYFLAFLTGLQAITDAWTLLHIVSLPASLLPMNDASAMADAFGGTGTLWALWWVALDVVIFGGAVYLTFVRPLRGTPQPLA